MKNWELIVILWSVVVISCDPCRDCGEPLAYEPTVKLIFVNQDSIDALNGVVNFNKDSIGRIDSLRTLKTKELNTLEEELETIDSLVEAGNDEYLDEQAALNAQITSLEVEDSVLARTKSLLDSVNRSSNATISSIKSGLLKVDTARLLTNGAEITYEDSMKNYDLPLLMDANQVDYEITIREKTFTFSLTYNLSETLDEARVFRVMATDIAAAGYTCDTLIFSCPNNVCVSNETTITAIY